jgi:hypothetical protein
MVQLLTTIITRAAFPIASGEEEDLPSLKELHLLARAVKDATTASKMDVEREARIREEAGKLATRRAAEAAVNVVKAAGASEETITLLRAKILGIDT